MSDAATAGDDAAAAAAAGGLCPELVEGGGAFIAWANCCPIATPAPSPTPAPASPPGLRAASPIALAAWYWVYAWRLPITPMLVRLSSAASTSGGSEMFSTTNFTSSRPKAAKSGWMRSTMYPDNWS